METIRDKGDNGTEAGFLRMFQLLHGYPLTRSDWDVWELPESEANVYCLVSTAPFFMAVIDKKIRLVVFLSEYILTDEDDTEPALPQIRRVSNADLKQQTLQISGFGIETSDYQRLDDRQLYRWHSDRRRFCRLQSTQTALSACLYHLGSKPSLELLQLEVTMIIKLKLILRQGFSFFMVIL